MYHNLRDFMFKNKMIFGIKIIRPGTIIFNGQVHVWPNFQEALCGAWNYDETPSRISSYCPECVQKVSAMYVKTFPKRLAINHFTRLLHGCKNGNGTIEKQFLLFQSGTKVSDIQNWIAETLEIPYAQVVMPWIS